MRTKEQVRADIAPLQAELERIDEAERKAEHKTLLGKCFRYRNSYGGGHPSWWLYAKVTAVGKWRPICLTFELTSINKVEIELHTEHTIHPGNGWQEITAKQFNAEWRKVRDRVLKVKP